VPPIQRALNRVDRWPDKQSVFDHFRPKAVFKGFTDEGLWDLVEHSTTEHPEEGVTLRFSKEWEARCYALVHNVWPRLSALDVPVLGFRGGKSNTLAQREWLRWQRVCGAGRYHELEGAGHLLPLERPEEISERYFEWQASLDLKALDGICSHSLFDAFLHRPRECGPLCAARKIALEGGEGVELS
jgi:pimeloyl-ACP methyl ester carboxylesterase